MYRGVERRAIRRHRTLKSGVIVLERDSIRCKLWDFSPVGVGLFVFDFDKAPPSFDLIIDDLPAELDLNFDFRHCISVWRKYNRIGVRYTAAV
jgi:hypothetical protein